MDRIIVYIDDAGYALQQLTPMEAGRPRLPTHWILVACPPRLARHVSKWVHQAARQNWRRKWSAALFARLTPGLLGQGDRITPVIAHGSLVGLTQSLLQTHGAARVLDARRPKLGQDLAPVVAGQPVAHDARWAVPGAVAGLGAVLVLAGE